MAARVLPNGIGQLLLQRILDGVGIKPNLMHLLGEALQIARVAVSDRDYGMTSVEVEVFCSFIVIDINVFGTNRGHLIEWINVE